MGMKSKKSSANKKGKSRKVSLTKLSNKHLNKLAKRGKLRKKVPKKELLNLLRNRTSGAKDRGEKVDENLDVQDDSEKELELEEEDIAFYKNQKNLGFILNLKSNDASSKSKKKKKKASAADSDLLEQNYAENTALTQPEKKQMKHLLPVKSKEKGIETRMIEDENAEDDNAANEVDENDEETQSALEPEQLPTLSTAEIFAKREKKLLEIKRNIASLASSLIENPESNVNKLRELRLLLEVNDPDVMVTTKKLTIVSLLEVFKDIIPGYPIRLATEKEKEQSASKETKALRTYEESLLRNYKHYLDALESLVKGQKLKTKDKTKSLEERVNGVQIPAEATQDLKALSLKCLCELLVSHQHFNFRQSIVNMAIPFIGHKKSTLSDMVCHYVKRIFREDRTGELTLEVVRCIGKVVKNCKFDVEPKVLYTFLSLKIKEVDRGTEEENGKKDKKKINRQFMSRRDKKRKKQMKELEKELEDAAVTQNKKKKLKLHTEVINSVFLTYFRILKQATYSSSLSAVLEGLAKFAHLINVDFFDDMFNVINDLVESGDLTYRECLHCVKTAFTLLTGQGSSLNIDPLHFYQHLYSTLFNLSAGDTSEDLEVALECLDIMITKRRKQISQQRLIGFIKRLTTLALQMSADGALGCLASARSLIVSDSKSEILYDTDNEGAGMYLPELSDPEHCNAHNTALYDLHLARRHYHPMVRKYADHMLSGCSSSTNGLLSDDVRKSPVNLFHEYDQSDLSFKPDIPEKPKVVKKLHLHGPFIQDNMESYCSELYENSGGEDVSKLQFCKGIENISDSNLSTVKLKSTNKKRKRTQ